MKKTHKYIIKFSDRSSDSFNLSLRVAMYLLISVSRIVTCLFDWIGMKYMCNSYIMCVLYK